MVKRASRRLLLPEIRTWCVRGLKLWPSCEWGRRLIRYWFNRCAQTLHFPFATVHLKHQLPVHQFTSISVRSWYLHGPFDSSGNCSVADTQIRVKTNQIRLNKSKKFYYLSLLECTCFFRRWPCGKSDVIRNEKNAQDILELKTPGFHATNVASNFFENFRVMICMYYIVVYGLDIFILRRFKTEEWTCFAHIFILN